MDVRGQLGSGHHLCRCERDFTGRLLFCLQGEVGEQGLAGRPGDKVCSPLPSPSPSPAPSPCLPLPLSLPPPSLPPSFCLSFSFFPSFSFCFYFLSFTHSFYS